MHEFETYVQSLLKSASANVTAQPTSTTHIDVPTEPVSTPLAQPAATPQAAPVAPTAVAGNQKMASAIQNAEAQLATNNPELLKAADDLAFMEAYTATKQANYLKDQVQEAIGMYQNFNQPQVPAYTQAAPTVNPYLAYGAKTASAEDLAEANALYAQAYNQALLVKTASEAQEWVDQLYMNNYNQILPHETQSWSNLAQQNYNNQFKGY